MTISTAERLTKVHEEALRDFNKIQSALRDERLQCLQDRRFYSIAGAQWEGPLGDQFENKPRYEFNDVHLAVIRVVNEYRNNRITVTFQPKDGRPADELAETVAGLYRADEKRCTAEESYDNGFEEAVGGGFGAWRVRAVYEDDEDDEDESQTCAIEPIFDADSCVFFDLDAKRADKADAKRCYVLTPYTHDAYKEEFGDDPATWPRLVHQSEFDWCTPKLVWVCELYRVEEVTELVRYFRGIDTSQPDMKVTQSEFDEDPEKEGELRATGFREVRQKRVKRRRVHKYLMSGGKVLEDCGFIAGRCIPIIPVYGKRWVVDGIERCMGHVRLAKDAQRLKNTLLSWLAEMSMRFDIEKPILTPEQIAGHAVMWAEDNIRKFPYLLLNPLLGPDGQPLPPQPVAYTKAPNIPPAMAALAQIAQQALQDLLGNQQAGEQVQPNISGKVVELIQQRLDMQVFIYMSNLAKAMKRCGEVWLSMKKDLVVEDNRRMKVITADDKPGSVVMNQPAIDEDGAQYTRNDLNSADLEVDVDVGPSSTSRRAATVRAVTGMLQLTQDPQTQQVLTAFAMMNVEGEGIEEIRGFFRRQLLSMGAVKPTKEEAAEIAQAQQAAGQQPPDPQSQYLMAAAEESQAKAAKARADTLETVASADLKHAQAEHVRSTTEHTDVKRGIDLNDAALRHAQAALNPPMPGGAPTPR